MKHHLHVQIENAEGALLRVLGTIERRGFSITRCHSSANESGSAELYLTVQGARQPDVLCRQLKRLVDVKNAALAADPAPGLLPV